MRLQSPKTDGKPLYIIDITAEIQKLATPGNKDLGCRYGAFTVYSMERLIDQASGDLQASFSQTDPNNKSPNKILGIAPTCDHDGGRNLEACAKQFIGCSEKYSDELKKKVPIKGPYSTMLIYTHFYDNHPGGLFLDGRFHKYDDRDEGSYVALGFGINPKTSEPYRPYQVDFNKEYFHRRDLSTEPIHLEANKALLSKPFKSEGQCTNRLTVV